MVSKTIRDGLGLHWSNLMPFVTIAFLAYIMWGLWQENSKLEKELQSEKEAVITAYETMGLIQAYNEERFKKLEKVNDIQWIEGVTREDSY